MAEYPKTDPVIKDINERIVVHFNKQDVKIQEKKRKRRGTFSNTPSL